MKIVNLGQRWNPYLNGKVRGGAEKVEANQNVLLRDAGHEVHFVTNDDSEDAPGVQMHRVGPSRLSLENPPRNFSRVRNDKIREIIAKVDPDVVICHDNDNSSLNRKLIPLAPCVNFVHSHVGMAGGLSSLTYIKSLWEMAQAGHATVCVSDSSRREWLLHARKSRKFLEGNGIPSEAIDSEDEIFTDWFHHAVTWEKPPVQEATKGYISIGRMVPTKRHQVGLKATQDLRIFCPPPGNEEQREVYAKLVKRFGSERINPTGVPDEVLNAEIAASKALLSFAQESFGLTAVEANILGVPVILSHKIEDHPIKEACAPSAEFGSLYVVPPSRSGAEVADFLASFEGLTLSERQKIQDATWDYYNPKASTDRLLELIHQTIERRKRRLTEIESKREAEGDVMGIFGV